MSTKDDCCHENKFHLYHNYLNQFNPSSTITYALLFGSEVRISIFDLNGKVIRTMNLGNQSSGCRSVIWDGRNDYGKSVSSGGYIYTFKAVSLEGNGESFIKFS